MTLPTVCLINSVMLCAALPILHQPRVFLYALPLLLVFLVLSLVLGINLCGSLMDFYHYRVL